MSREVLSGREKNGERLRYILVPDWVWQLTWLRHVPEYIRSLKNCPRSRWKILFDMLYIFIVLRTVPEHYGPCRLWEMPRSKWVYYYGSPYTPIQRGRIGRRVYPVDYELLYDDKRVGAQLSRGLEVRQPRNLGQLDPSPSFRDRVMAFFEQSGKKKLMLKPAFGRGGMGIVLLERSDASVIVRTPEATLPLDQFELKWPVFVQEVIEQDPRLAAIWHTTVNTVRLTTLRTANDNVLVLAGGIRFGVGDAYVDNWSAGGISVGIDVKTGRLRKYAWDKFGTQHTQHPGSGFVFENYQIPEWDRLVETACKIAMELPFSRLVGADLCLDHDGTPMLIEINGLPDLVPAEQLNGPLLVNQEILHAFADYDMLVSRAQKRLLASQTAPAAAAPARGRIRLTDAA